MDTRVPAGDGQAIVGAAPMPPTVADGDAPRCRNRERGVEPDWRTGLPPGA